MITLLFNYKNKQILTHDIVELTPDPGEPDESEINNPYLPSTPTKKDKIIQHPFEVIIEQQFYEVTPDPRNCTTLATDYNIYSSRINCAVNIMTMRRDFNIVGGNVEVLLDGYSILKQQMVNFQEQMFLHAA